MNQDRNPFSPEATALYQRADARLPEEEAVGDDERSSRNRRNARHEEEDHFAQLVTMAPGGLFSFRLRPDGSTCCPYANPAFLELLGLPPEALAESAAALRALIHPDDLDRVRTSVAASARTLTPWQDEFRWRRSSGEEVWVEGHAMPVREPDGGTLWHGFLQNITARKETERRLFETRERLQALLQALPVGVCFSDDPTCQRITGNPALLAQFEMAPQDNISAAAPEAAALGRRVRYLLHGRELGEAELPLQRAVAENRVIPPLELEVRLPSGRRWIAEILAAPLHDARDRIIGGLAVTLDITERKRAEECYQTLFEQMLDGFALHEILCDERGRPVDYRFLAVNPAFERLTGLKAPDIVGKTVREVLPGIEPYWIETYGQVALTGEPASFENYARDLDQYFQVTAFRPASRQFACLFTDVTAYKQADEEIRKFRTIADKANYGAALTDLKGHLLYVNETFARMHGWEPAELLGRHLSAFHSEDQLARVEALLERLVREGDFAAEEVWHRKRDGSVFPTLMNASVIQDAAGASRFLSATVLDISARKQAEDALWKTQNRLAEAQKIAHLGSFEYNVATRQTVWSDEEYRIYGLEPAGPAPVYDTLLAQCIHPDDAALLHRTFTTALQRVSVYELEHRIVRPDGSVRWVYNLAHPYFDANGQLVRYIGTTLDITERKRDEEQLRRSEERLRLATDGAELGIWYWDMSTGALEWSGRCKRHLGLPPGKEPSFEHFYAVMHPDDRGRIERLLAQAVENRSDYQADYRVTWADGSLHWISALGRVYGAAQGALIGMGGATIDITVRKQAEEEREKLQAQLAQAQKMESIGRLAGGVAHDFNNLLGVILGHTELALESANPAQPLYADLLEIQKAAQRSADLTRQLLAFARKQTIVPQVCDLNEAVSAMLKLLRRLIGEPIALIWRPDPHLWPVKVDPVQIDQILTNLCVNARDAIAGAGQIIIETGNARLDEIYCAQRTGFVPGDYIRLAVSDDGCGMDAETLAHLFEPFFTTKGVGQGTGLGLAILYGVVKQNQGFINVYSEPGQGTIFTLYLPRHRGQAAPTALAGSAEPAHRGHETVLLVEDEPALLHLGAMMLEKLGYRVLAADTPGEAIRLAEEHIGAIHLLITDVVMPEMNGRDLAQRLLSLYPNLKRLFMSGYPANVIAPHGVLDEGVHFLQKPFALQELAAKICEALERES